MKILTINGSPKKSGNTAGALKMFEERVAGVHEVDLVDVADLDLVGCQGCYACMQDPNEPGCAQKDDMQGVYTRILDADAVVYATPLYVWGIASKMKGLMERHLAFVTGYGSDRMRSLTEGKRVAFLVTCGGPVEGNADVVQTVFDRFSSFGKSDLVGKYVVPGCSTPDAIGDAAGDVVEKMAGDFTA